MCQDSILVKEANKKQVSQNHCFAFFVSNLSIKPVMSIREDPVQIIYNFTPGN